VGVNFTDEQKDQIKAMVEAGDIMGAQKIILQELQTEFGGSAVAAGQTFGGQMDILGNRIANVKEAIGGELLPILTELATRFSEWLSSMQVQDVISGFIEKVNEISEAFSYLLSSTDGWGMDGLFKVFEDGSSILGGFLERLGIAEEPAEKFAKTFIDITSGLRDALERLQSFIKNDRGFIAGGLAALGAVIATFVYTTMVPAAVALITAWAPVIAVLALVGLAGYFLYWAWTENWGGIQEKTRAVIDWLMPKIQELKDGIGKTLATIQAWWDEHEKAIVATVKRAWQVVSDLFAAFSSGFEGDWYSFGVNLRKAMDELGALLTDFWFFVWDQIKLVDWEQLGMDVLNGIKVGMLTASLELIKACQQIAQNVLDAFKGFFGIHSPSSLTGDEIGVPMAEGIILDFGKTLERGMNIPSVSRVMAMQPTFVNVSYAPLISTASELEATEALRGVFQRLSRE
jgi:zinc transporter ZupT